MKENKKELEEQIIDDNASENKTKNTTDARNRAESFGARNVNRKHSGPKTSRNPRGFR